MSIADESLRAPTPIGTALGAGVDAISLNQKIAFDLYVRLVLPFDGYVFWVKAADVSESAVLNAMGINAATPNQGAGEGMPAPQFVVEGSLHYATDSRQTEAANYASNRVVLTSKSAVQDLNDLGANLLYISTFDAPTPGSGESPAGTTRIMFAFSGRSSYYRQANLWHYVGDAVYPTMATQVIEDVRSLNASEVIVSNSLPIWLNFNHYNPAWPVLIPRPLVTMYPSMLVPDNLRPPYVAVHIDPGSTRGVQMAPWLGHKMTNQQLGIERVTLTLYGFNNRMAHDLLDSLLQYSLDTKFIGFTNSPFVMDEKEGQNELNTLAQKKRIVFEVSYNQGVVRNIARQLILTCVPTFKVGDEIIPVT